MKAKSDAKKPEQKAAGEAKKTDKPAKPVDKKKKPVGLLKKLADAKEGLQIKLAHASRGKPDSVATQTNDSLLAGADEQTQQVLTLFRSVSKAGRATSDRLDAAIKAEALVVQQTKMCADLARAPQVQELMKRWLLHLERDSEQFALLMNGFSNGLSLALDDFIVKKEKELKNSKMRYDQSLVDYGVSVRKAQVRLGKGPEYMDATRYLKAAVGREICLQNYEQVTSEHLAEHHKIDAARNLELCTELHRGQESQVKFVANMSRETFEMLAACEKAVQWARNENEVLSARMRDAAIDDFAQEEARLWESHDDLMKFLAQPNAMHCFLKAPEIGQSSVESILTAAFDDWGLSEGLLLDLISRNPLPDDTLPLFSGNKVAERILAGYIHNHLGEWHRVCWQPMIDKLLVEPERYAMGKPQGMSATLTLTELVIERICDTIDTFPPLFARLCQVPGVVPSLMGGRVFKQCLTGFTKLADPARTSAEVVAFLLWEILRGRQFSVIEPARAASLKMSITVAHHVSENVDMLRNWASSPPLQLLRQTFLDMSRTALSPMPIVTVEAKLASVREGGAVSNLLQFIRVRQDVLSNIFLEADRVLLIKFCDLFQKASVASLRGASKGDVNKAVQLMISGENSVIEDDDGLSGDIVDFRSITALSLGTQYDDGGDTTTMEDILSLSSSSGPSTVSPVPPPQPMNARAKNSPPPTPSSRQVRALVSPRPSAPSEPVDDAASHARSMGARQPTPIKQSTSAASLQGPRLERSKSSEGTRPARPPPPTTKPIPGSPSTASVQLQPGTNAFAAMRKPQKPTPEMPQKPIPEPPQYTPQKPVPETPQGPSVTPPLPPKIKR